MPEKIKNPEPPQGLSRILFRLPIWFYRLRLGWLLGNRFMLIHHIGRKSGQIRQAVVEVVRHDPTRDTYIVAVGFGEQTQWYQNLLANPDVTIQVGRRTLQVHAEMLTPEGGGDEFVDYTRRNPRVAKSLLGMIGYRVDGSEEDYYAVGKLLPFIAFRPQT